MSQVQTSYSSKEKEKGREKESDIASKNLWIGELEQWMDSTYLIEACHSYSKYYFIKKIILILIFVYYYRCSNKNSESNS